MSCTIQQLADFVGGTLRGDGLPALHDVGALESAGPQQVSYLAADRELRRLCDSRAGAIIVSRPLADAAQKHSGAALIVVDDAQASFIQAMLRFRPLKERLRVGISPRAHVSLKAKIGPDCNIHPGATIADGAVLGARCEIHPGAIVGPGGILGDDVTLHANAVLYADVRIGCRVIIHACAVVGADGFGYRFDGGRFIRIPHTGTVIIEDDVEIGACTTVDRAMIGATVVGAGTKLDNLVMIAHNCVLGKHNAFAAQVGLAGSVTTGDYVRCGGQVGVADHAHLGSGCTLGGKAGASGTIPDGERYHGLPARPEKEAVKAHLAVGHLPEMRTQLRRLQRQVKQLQAQLAQLTGAGPHRDAA